MIAKKGKSSSVWLWSISAVAVFSLTGCQMYPSKANQWPPGIWGDILKFVSSVMDFLAHHVFFQNYGLALIALTIIVRLIVLPLMIRQIRYQKVMQQMQPHIARIREQHKGDSQRINQETMKLWQEHGVNPMAGCFPMVIQLPILYALFGAIKGNQGLNDYTFLGIFQMGHPDHFYILPILAAVTTYLSSRVMMVGQDSGQQKMMLIFMPIMVFVLGMRFASGLALYWIVSNLFTAAQTYFIKVKPAAAAAAAGGTTAAIPVKSGPALKAKKSSKSTTDGSEGSGKGSKK